MLNKIIKLSFAFVGAFTGFTLINTFVTFSSEGWISQFKVFFFITASLLMALLFYSTGSKMIEGVLKVLDALEAFIHGMTLYELALSAIGLIAGLIVANLISIPVHRIEIIGIPLAIIANILFGSMGIVIAVGKKNEALFESFKGKGGIDQSKGFSPPKILDTSVIIDGRIVDIVRSGFLEGELVVPSFVLEELRHIADSSDALKRNRGRRGLDVLNMIQKELERAVRVENIDIADGAEVDSELLKAAKKLNGIVMTVDYNLSKVANFQKVPVLNVNELANAVKPIALPGEEMTVQVIKDGKENGQGVGYLDDGTMIVIEGGRRHIGESICVMVTSILQTAAGRMIFAKPKYSIERVI